MIFDFSLPNNFAKDSPKKDLALPEGANGLVVHCCCAPCSTSLVECLIFNKVKPLMFFYNPNIYPLEEYEKRRDEWSHLCDLLDLDYVVGDYDYKKWQEKVKAMTEIAEFIKENGKDNFDISEPSIIYILSFSKEFKAANMNIVKCSLDCIKSVVETCGVGPRIVERIVTSLIPKVCIYKNNHE